MNWLSERQTCYTWKSSQYEHQRGCNWTDVGQWISCRCSWWVFCWGKDQISRLMNSAFTAKKNFSMVHKTFLHTHQLLLSSNHNLRSCFFLFHKTQVKNSEERNKAELFGNLTVNLGSQSNQQWAWRWTLRNSSAAPQAEVTVSTKMTCKKQTEAFSFQL